MKRYADILLPAVSGLLAGAAYCHESLPVPAELMLIGWVPLLWTLFGPTVDTRAGSGVLLPLYVAFFVFHGVSNWWISSWQEQTDPYLMASGIAVWLGHPFFLMLPWLVLRWIDKKLSRRIVLVLVPLVTTAFEWLHGQTDLSYPWLSLGYSLVDRPLAQVADVVGVYGLTFLIMIINVLAYSALQRRSDGRGTLLPVSLALVGCAVWTVWGFARQREWTDSRPAVKMTVAVVQPNINPWDKWSAPSEQLVIHRQITDSLVRAGESFDLVVWSETAIPYVIRNYRYMGDWVNLRTWIDTSGCSLLTGFADMMVYENGSAPASARSLVVDPSVKYDHFNAAMLLNPGETGPVVHRKTMLTPFAERLPFADQLSFAMQWFEWGVGISSWGKGRERVPMQVRSGCVINGNVGPIICIESIYPDVARDMVNNGADVLAIITNDAWYNGTWGPRQHYDIARMRAIEMRRYVIRCANSGVSGIIGPTGHSTLELPEMRRTAAVGTVTCSTNKTFYALNGDWLPIICAAITLLAALLARFQLFLRILPASFVRQSSHISHGT
ncbi:MAG: apolipoprotein N-acyltransferase [Candidatus Kapabacteria bacterium]|nr:apolipoprotein N-acyltransferase [Candidatus Kapabacteria bacterium]